MLSFAKVSPSKGSSLHRITVSLSFFLKLGPQPGLHAVIKIGVGDFDHGCSRTKSLTLVSVPVYRLGQGLNCIQIRTLICTIHLLFQSLVLKKICYLAQRALVTTSIYGFNSATYGDHKNKENTPKIHHFVK